jgi:molecular chaperone GrpE
MSNDNLAEEQGMGAAKSEEGKAGLETRVAELEAQLAEIKNESLRYLADAENTRRRAAKEKEDTVKYAVTKFAREILDVADNLQRALQAAQADKTDASPAIKNLMTGVEATERQLISALERAGIRKIDPLGKMFDPNLHQVMMEVEAADKPPGTILQVMQPGYTIHDRLLREAMVTVAKGGPTPHIDQKV